MIPSDSIRNIIFKYIKDNYGINPVYPWDLLNEYAVFSHKDSRKWFGLIMNVDSSKLGFAPGRVIDVLDVRATAEDIDHYVSINGFLPAYHMSRQSWLTILLNGSVSLHTITELIDKSYALTRADNNIRFTSSYQDQPLPARKNISPALPDTLQKLKSIYDPLSRTPGYEALCFYQQAKTAEDYEDDYDFKGRFIRFYPTYHVMNDDQLRGYFSWRSKYRQGIVQSPSISFVYLYLYELLAGIGVHDPMEGYNAIIKADRIFGDKDPGLHDNIQLWLHDYVVYYNLDYSLIPGGKSSDILTSIASLSDADSSSLSDEELFACLCTVSAYDPSASLMYKKSPDDMVYALSRVYKGLNHYLLEHSQSNLIERSYGTKAVMPCQLFRTAVFYDHLQYKDYEYRIGSGRIYRCKNGNWTLEGYITAPEKSKEIGAICKETDRQLRELTKSGHPLKKTPGLSPAILSMIRELVGDYLKDKIEAARPKVKIDFSSLSAIRSDAAITRDKLIVDEDEAEFILNDNEASPVVSAKDQEAADNEKASIGDIASETLAETDIEAVNETDHETGNNSAFFNPVQKDIIGLLLNGGDLKSYALKKKLMLSTEIDEINNLLYDEIGDIVIEFEADTPLLVEDYIEDLKKYLS